MQGDKIKKFMALAGQVRSESLRHGTPEERKLGAQLLLSEVLEYIVHGLKVVPKIEGVEISKPDHLDYAALPEIQDNLEVIDGLADVAYTMYWNATAFGIPLEEAFELVCDNNLEKFVRIPDWSRGEIELTREEWCVVPGLSWPQEVVLVKVIDVDGEFYAVGKDARGKVRKPSTYKPVDLTPLLP